MRPIRFALALVSAVPISLAAQSVAPHTVSDAYRTLAQLNAGRIIAAAEAMPDDRYGFKPTPAQMTFGEVVIHVIEGNDDLATIIGKASVPSRTPVTARDSKRVLVARLKETFAFCMSAVGHVDDTMLSDSLPDYGTRAGALFSSINHWSDHYSQMAIYLRLNGVLPPTARGN